jgi:hypothetical protein
MLADIIRSHAMKQPIHHHDHAARGRGACTGAGWNDSGITPGLVVVDSNRPSAHTTGLVAGAARELRMQLVAAHH